MQFLPQLAVRAIKEGVVERDRWSKPIRGAPSEPLKDDPDPETQRYFVETVCDLSLWKSEIVEPWLMHTTKNGLIMHHKMRSRKLLTLKVFSTLTFLAGLADDLDRTTWKGTDYTLRLIVGRGGSNLNQSFDFLLLFVDVRNEKLFPDTTSDVCSACWWVTNIEGLA